MQVNFHALFLRVYFVYLKSIRTSSDGRAAAGPVTATRHRRPRGHHNRPAQARQIARVQGMLRPGVPQRVGIIARTHRGRQFRLQRMPRFVRAPSLRLPCGGSPVSPVSPRTAPARALPVITVIITGSLCTSYTHVSARPRRNALLPLAVTHRSMHHHMSRRSRRPYAGSVIREFITPHNRRRLI